MAAIILIIILIGALNSVYIIGLKFSEQDGRVVTGREGKVNWRLRKLAFYQIACIHISLLNPPCIYIQQMSPLQQAQLCLSHILM